MSFSCMDNLFIIIQNSKYVVVNGFLLLMLDSKVKSGMEPEF